MRHAADVIRVGAAAVRIENYSGAVIRRAAAGPAGAAEAEVPPIAVVTQTGDLDPSALLFTRTEVPPPILTCSQSFADTAAGSARWRRSSTHQARSRTPSTARPC